MALALLLQRKQARHSNSNRFTPQTMVSIQETQASIRDLAAISARLLYGQIQYISASIIIMYLST